MGTTNNIVSTAGAAPATDKAQPEAGDTNTNPAPPNDPYKGIQDSMGGLFGILEKLLSPLFAIMDGFQKSWDKIRHPTPVDFTKKSETIQTSAAHTVSQPAQAQSNQAAQTQQQTPNTNQAAAQQQTVTAQSVQSGNTGGIKVIFEGSPEALAFLSPILKGGYNPSTKSSEQQMAEAAAATKVNAATSPDIGKKRQYGPPD